MGSRRQQERQHKRAIEHLTKMMEREDAEGAVAVLLRLPSEERDERVAGVAALLAREIGKAHDRAAWDRLAQCAAWVEREPRLVTAVAREDGAAVAAIWPLFWGCARSAQWERAERQWARIRSELVRRAPELVAALDVWVSARGRPDQHALAQLVIPELPAGDPRLGYEPVGRARELAPPSVPRSAGEVERAVIAACATRPWRRFADLMVDWIRQTSGAARTSIAVLAGQLAMRELLQRACAGPQLGPPPGASSARSAGKAGPSGREARAGRSGHERAVREPARLLVQVIRATSADDLAGEALLAFRVLLTQVPRRGLEAGELARDLVGVARVILRYPQHRSLVAHVWVHTPVLASACKSVLELCEDLTAVAPDVAVCAKAARVWLRAKEMENENDDVTPPDWLCRGFGQAFERPAEILAWLRDAEQACRQEMLDFVRRKLPIEMGADLVDRAWQGADEPLRQDLCGIVRALLARSGQRGRASRGVPSMAALLALVHQVESSEGRRAHREIRSLLNAAQGDPEIRQVLFDMLEDMVDHECAVSPAAAELWRRFEQRLLPYSEAFLAIALSVARTSQERRSAVERYLGGRKDIESRLEVLRHLAGTGDRALARAVEGRLVAGYRDDVEALARGFGYAFANGAPASLYRALAAALVEADSAHPGQRSDMVEKLLRSARLLLAPRGGRGEPRPKRTPTPKAKAKAKSKSKSKPPPEPGREGTPASAAHERAE